ncbi:MAG TPA: right-handed parallel beta-helix repeat-containing protein [Cellvibrionaceae bacterium]
MRMRFAFLCFVSVFFIACTTKPGVTRNADNATVISDFGMHTPGGLGGQILKVTNLNPSGEGSLAWALAEPGPRVVVFEVGGVINLAGINIDILEPFLTVAGQTAPSPGITLIRGGLSIRTHDVRIEHLRVRPGANDNPAQIGWDTDAIGISRKEARDIHINQCSVSWAVDENMAASGERYKGPEATSGRITFSYSIIAEALDYASHKKGKHSKGLLVHDFVQEVAVIGNLFAHNDRRNPYFKAHASGIVANNLMYNLGNAAVQLGYIADEWADSEIAPANPQVAVVGNHLIYGRDTYSDLPLVAYQGDAYLADNRVDNLDGDPMAQVHGDVRLLQRPPLWIAGYEPLPVAGVKEHVLNRAGARPWDRDAIDQRIIASVRERSGRIIDSEADVGGYPQELPASYRALDVPTHAAAQEAWLLSFIPEAYR